MAVEVVFGFDVGGGLFTLFAETPGLLSDNVAIVNVDAAVRVLGVFNWEAKVVGAGPVLATDSPFVTDPWTEFDEAWDPSEIEGDECVSKATVDTEDEG